MTDHPTLASVAVKQILQVSIGMPVFNGEKFIREALDSLLAQTFTDFELIISDNASTDGTEAICREYAATDARIRYVRQVKNLGAIANFKFVLDEAVGEYFMWAAADDVWGKNWIKILLPVSVDSQCLAYGMVQTIDVNGNHMQHPANGRKFNYAGSKFIRRLKYYLEPSLLGKANPIYGIYPKNILTKEVFSMLALGNAVTDMLFLYRLLADADIKCDAAVFLYKRIHDDCAGGGIMRASKNKNYLAVVPEVLINVTCYQWRQILNYGKQSSPFERVAQIVLSPVLLIVNLFYVVVKNPRFSSQ
jgi:glycosyltransferase involved in cell wall biosynthesis